MYRGLWNTQQFKPEIRVCVQAVMALIERKELDGPGYGLADRP
jgi:hypothetical protein